MTEVLLKRVAVLEGVLGDETGDVVSVLKELQRSLVDNTNVQSLQDVMAQCGVLNTSDASREEDSLSIEEKKAVVLAHYDRYMKVVSSAELLVSEYSDIFERFYNVVSVAPTFDIKLVAQRYQQIATKFTQLVKQMVAVLERYAILRFRQSKLMSETSSG